MSEKDTPLVFLSGEWMNVKDPMRPFCTRGGTNWS